MGGEDEAFPNHGSLEWTPVPAPLRPSPFYHLRSIAFAPRQDVFEEKLVSPRTAGDSGSKFLPPVAAASSLASQSRGQVTSCASSQPPQSKDKEAAQPAQSEEDVLAALVRRRDALYADQQRLDLQLELVRRRTTEACKTGGKLKRQLEASSQKVKPLSVSLKTELSRIYEQQKVLKSLRTELKELQQGGGGGEHQLDALHLPGRAQGEGGGAQEAATGGEAATKAEEAAPAPAAAAGVKPPSAEGSQKSRRKPPPSPVQLSSSGQKQASGKDEAVLGSPSVDSALLSVQAEMEKITQALTSAEGHTGDHAAPAAAAAGKEKKPAAAAAERALRMPAADEEDEADVQLIGSNGVALALLRHPGGGHALIDLRAGLVFCWRLADGSACAPGSFPAACPDIVDEPDSDMLPWRLTLMDDSNNEPSVTLLCGGRGNAKWRCRRTITLCSDYIQEALSVENLASEEGTFTVQEKSYDDVVETRPQDILLPVGEASLVTASKVQLTASPAVQDTGTTVSLPANGTWSVAHCWMVK